MLVWAIYALNVVPPGWFSDWQTGGYEVGNCFKKEWYMPQREYDFVKIVSIKNGLNEVEFKYDAVSEFYEFEAQPTKDGLTRLSQDFKDLYKVQIRCSEYEKFKDKAEFVSLRNRVRELEWDKEDRDSKKSHR